MIVAVVEPAPRTPDIAARCREAIEGFANDIPAIAPSHLRQARVTLGS